MIPNSGLSSLVANRAQRKSKRPSVAKGDARDPLRTLGAGRVKLRTLGALSDDKRPTTIRTD
jgi:hypothetical protein